MLSAMSARERTLIELRNNCLRFKEEHEDIIEYIKQRILHATKEGKFSTSLFHLPSLSKEDLEYLNWYLNDLGYTTDYQKDVYEEIGLISW